MSVSTTTFGPKVWAAPLTDFPQFRGDDKREVYFDEHNPFSLEKTTAQIRTRMIFEHLEEIPDSQKQAQSPLQAILSRTLHIGPCVTGLVGGTFGSLVTQHPLPLLLGLTQCFLGASAQQKVGNEFQINNITLLWQVRPSVTRLNNRNFITTWHGRQFPNDAEIFGQLFNENGNKIGSEIHVNTYTFSWQQRPSVAELSNTNFVVIWESLEQDGSLAGIYGQLYDQNEIKIGSEFRVNTYTTNNQIRPSVASLSNGNFVVTWDSFGQDGSSWGGYGQLFDGNGTKIGNEFRINTFTNNGQFDSSVAGLSNGNFVVTWQSPDQDGDIYGIFGQLFFANGSKIGSEFQVNTYIIGEQENPSVVSLSNGNFVVVWESNGQDGSGYGIYGQKFDESGNPIGAEFQINTFTILSQINPSVTSLGKGNFVVAWDSWGDGSSTGIFGQLFDENATKVGNEFQVNTYTSNSQEQPSVAYLENGNFVVTWESDGQDGSDYGIYGQIFHDNITYPPTSSTTSSSTLSTTSSSTTSTTSSTSSSTTSSSTTTSSSSMTTSTSSSSATSTTSSSTVSTFKSTTLRSSVEISHAISSSSPPSKKRLLWLWLLLGLGGGAICLGGIGYLFKRSKDEQEDDDVQAAELETREQPDHMTVEGDYLRTPDFVTQRQESDYQYTPDHVSAERESDYQYTPDHVSAVQV